MSDFFKIPHSSEGLIKPKSRLHQAFPREQLWPQPQSFLPAPNHGSSSPGARNGDSQVHIHEARHLFALQWKRFSFCVTEEGKKKWRLKNVGWYFWEREETTWSPWMLKHLVRGRCEQTQALFSECLTRAPFAIRRDRAFRIRFISPSLKLTYKIGQINYALRIPIFCHIQERGFRLTSSNAAVYSVAG